MRIFIPAVFVLTLSLPATAQDGAAVYKRHCASCHDNPAVRAPARDALGALSAARVTESLETGVMRVQGEALSAAERRAIAAFVSAPSAAPPGAASGSACAAPSNRQPFSIGDPALNWNGWGASLGNDRYQPRPGLTAADVPRLKLRWAFGFAGENAAATQPVIVGRRVFVGSGSGQVHSLDLASGCVHWVFKADAGVRAAVTVAPVNRDGTTRVAAFFGDLRGNAYALDAADGTLLWKRQVETHRAARVTGSPVFYDGRLYVPMSSIEEVTGSAAAYECCTFRGSVTALDAASGQAVWQTYTIPEAPRPTSKNAVGTQLWGPAGAAVWHAPTIDPATGSLYVATGDAYTHPAAPTSDAVMALDLRTGVIKWSHQLTEGDAWNMACVNPDRSNCPEPEGPDFDFGQPPILLAIPGGRRALVVGQKSGAVHALDPDEGGRVLYSRKIGRGGIIGGFEWGSASDGQFFYAPLSDLVFTSGVGARRLDPQAGGGLFALRPADGTVAWSAPARPCTVSNCSPAQTAPASVMPGVVFSGSLDGHLRAYAAGDGAVLWAFDTAREFDTVNGVRATGGSIDVGGPAIAEGLVLTTSGYSTWGGRRGNVLLAFGVD
jgi:polyvinyl alcohol dehydrogenase (cytochrome)